MRLMDGIFGKVGKLSKRRVHIGGFERFKNIVQQIWNCVKYFYFIKFKKVENYKLLIDFPCICTTK